MAQTEVIFFKKEKKETKATKMHINNSGTSCNNQSTQQSSCYVPRNTITNFRHNDVNDEDFDQYKLELSVLIGDKTHTLCIKFQPMMLNNKEQYLSNISPKIKQTNS